MFVKKGCVVTSNQILDQRLGSCTISLKSGLNLAKNIYQKKKNPSTVTSVQVVSSFNVPPTSSFDQVHFRPPCKTIVQTLYFLDLPLSVIYYAHRVVDKGYAMILNFIIFLSLRQSKASKMHFNVTSTTFFRKQALNRR